MTEEQTSGFKEWFLEGIKPGQTQVQHQDSWWRVMCLTGVDYFSTLGYQPGIAFLAAGVLSPLATIILVLVTLFGALPVYCIVAKESPHGQGSVAMLERMFPGWTGKTLVLALLGFAATAFIITITLSAADATAHIVENPIIPESWRSHRVEVTFVLIALLGALFLKGFHEAIGLSVFIVVFYLFLSAIILGKGTYELSFVQPQLPGEWVKSLFDQYRSIPMMIGLSLLMFPKLALGLSGFETGVAVLPLVKGYPSDTEENPVGRIRNGQYLLIAAGAIMSVFLIVSSFVTTMLIPASLFQPGGEANGRALAYLAHEHLGAVFGTVYDISTILILWFAGASAIAGLLSLVPKYLPRYGMAPGWAAAVRPLVVFFTVVAFGVTFMFKAGVDVQAGAYATGVLVLITSAAIAATTSVWKSKPRGRYYFAAIAFIFVYTCFANMSERPEGVQIALFFIGSVLVASVLSRSLRATELRVDKVVFDDKALEFIEDALNSYLGEVRILAHKAGMKDFREDENRSRFVHSIQPEEGNFIFLEVKLSDASEFAEDLLEVTGHEENGYKILRCANPAVPNAIAAILLEIRDRTRKIPHAYLSWTEGNPIAYTVKYIFLGEGETATVTREILRGVEPYEKSRPIIHVG
ncbi:MAG: amino acid transporter [Candidatus Melainabacteria bacterium]|nr:amino acid transporter [Candidatus Melainabacteria bacterium]